MSEYSMYDLMQSAYKLVHSTETALVKMNYDILISLDAGKCTVLVSIDLSVAFDTINHNILLIMIQYLYGITGTAFKWFQSYIEQRNNQVCVGDSFSQRRSLTSGVPQGSVLGDRLFTMYTYHLALILNKHKLEYHSYVDDTQVYLHCDNNLVSLRHAVHQLENCIFDIFDICEYVKILGVIFDNRMTLQKHNNQHLSVCQHTHQEDKQHQTIPLRHCCENLIIIFILSPISNVYKDTSSVDL